MGWQNFKANISMNLLFDGEIAHDAYHEGVGKAMVLELVDIALA